MKKIFYLAVFSTLIWSQACVQSPSKKNETVKVDFLMEHKARQPEIKNGKTPMMILLHGLRSNERDLFAIAPMLDERLLVVSVRAPYNAGDGRYKWYDYQSNPKGSPIIDTRQAEDSRMLLIQFIDQLVEAYNADAKRVYIGGFSQGAMMSYAVGLTRPDKVKGIASFSGNIPNVLKDKKDKLTEKNALSNLSVFISHGKKDNVLPFADALADKDFLEQMGIKTSFHSYETAHTMSRQNIMDFQQWISGEL